jgi:hypothetical protein
MSLASIWKRRVLAYEPVRTHWQIVKYTLLRSDGARIPMLAVAAPSLPACALAAFIAQQGHDLGFDTWLGRLSGDYTCKACNEQRKRHTASKNPRHGQ